MKVKINETQLNRLKKQLTLNEVGGYDSTDLMAFHGGMVQGEIVLLVSKFVSLLESLIDGLKSGEMSKKILLGGVLALNQEIESNIKRLGELTSEIYIDDDFKSIMKSYIRTLNKVSKFFKLLVDVRSGVYGGSIITGITGIADNMTKEELELQISEKLATLGGEIEQIGEIIHQMRERYRNRLEKN
jgi:hypothetical protein